MSLFYFSQLFLKLPVYQSQSWVCLWHFSIFPSCRTGITSAVPQAASTSVPKLGLFMSLCYFPSCRTGITSAVPQAASTLVTKLRSVYVTFLFFPAVAQVSLQLFLNLPVHQSQSWGLFMSLFCFFQLFLKLPAEVSFCHFSFSQLSPQVYLQLFFKLPVPQSESHGKEMSSFYFFPTVNSSRIRLKLAVFYQPYLPIIICHDRHFLRDNRCLFIC